MPITLAQAKVGMANHVDQQVIDQFRRGSMLLEALTFDYSVSLGSCGSSLSYVYTQLMSPAGADFLGALAVHVCLTVTDELLGERIQLIEVVGSVILPIVPFAAEPVHVFTDGIHVFGIFLQRIGIVEA